MILVPVDLSAATTQVADAACRLAQQTGARLEFLHVIEAPPVVMSEYFAFDAGALAGAVSAGEKFARLELRALVRRYARKVARVRTIQRTGHPVAEIIATAVAHKAVYIVLGSHGHTAVYDLLVGSTTQGVLRKAPCPVIVVPVAEN
jgi:nucleotide-binding universal stress UspA family protein